MTRVAVILFLLIPSLLLHARPALPTTENCWTSGSSPAPTPSTTSADDSDCACCALAGTCCCSIDEPAPSRPIPAPVPTAPRSPAPDFTALPDWSGTPMPLPVVVHAVRPDRSFQLTHRPVESAQALLCVWRT